MKSTQASKIFFGFLIMLGFLFVPQIVFGRVVICSPPDSLQPQCTDLEADQPHEPGENCNIFDSIVDCATYTTNMTASPPSDGLCVDYISGFCLPAAPNGMGCSERGGSFYRTSDSCSQWVQGIFSISGVCIIEEGGGPVCADSSNGACEGSEYQPIRGGCVEWEKSQEAVEQAKKDKKIEALIVSLRNPLGSSYEFPVIVGNLIGRLFGFLGVLTLGAFVYGGFMWVFSAGSEEKIQKGIKAITYAAIGLFIIFSAYGILNLLLTSFIRAS